MAEHPNYKYRPRRRKHTKSRAGPQVLENQVGNSGNGATPGSNGGSLAAAATTSSGASVEHFDDGISSYHMNNGYFNKVSHPVGTSNSNSLHTPDSSPTQSPEPISAVSGKVNGENIKLDDNVPALPTPEMSPLELSEKKINESFMEYAGRENSGENVLMMDGVAVSSGSVSGLNLPTYAMPAGAIGKRDYYTSAIDSLAGKPSVMMSK